MSEDGRIRIELKKAGLPIEEGEDFFEAVYKRIISLRLRAETAEAKLAEAWEIITQLQGLAADLAEPKP